MYPWAAFTSMITQHINWSGVDYYFRNGKMCRVGFSTVFFLLITWILSAVDHWECRSHSSVWSRSLFTPFFQSVVNLSQYIDCIVLCRPNPPFGFMIFSGTTLQIERPKKRATPPKNWVHTKNGAWDSNSLQSTIVGRTIQSIWGENFRSPQLFDKKIESWILY